MSKFRVYFTVPTSTDVLIDAVTRDEARMKFLTDGENMLIYAQQQGNPYISDIVIDCIDEEKVNED